MSSRCMKLFDDVVPLDKQHPIYRLIKDHRFGPERAVLEEWAEGFVDRDGKFCHEFQKSFEPCLWELYVHAYLKHVGAQIDFSFHAPDFVVSGDQEYCVEATIAAPPVGGKPAYGWGYADIPEYFNKFNSEATLRICNSFTAKVRKYRETYSQLSHVNDKPYVIAIASYDRPFSHMAVSRPIVSALYGLYYDEDLTLAKCEKNVINYNVESVIKSGLTNVPLGYFTNASYSDVSAVIYSCLATWGKVRALAVNPTADSIYTTFHPNSNNIHATVLHTPKAQYKEHLLDGLYVFHNPFAANPLDTNALTHPRIAQAYVAADGEIRFEAPDDFLLLRFLQSGMPQS